MSTQDTDPTKLKSFLKAHQIHSCCGKPVLHMALQVFLKCEKCGAPLTKGVTLGEIKTVQDDSICP